MRRHSVKAGKKSKQLCLEIVPEIIHKATGCRYVPNKENRKGLLAAALLAAYKFNVL